MSSRSYDLQIGPFIIRLTTALPAVMRNISWSYANQISPAPQPFADFHIRIDRMPSLRGWLRPQSTFWLDGVQPFKPLGLSQAPAFFEWGLNWCIAQTRHEFLQLHAAVVARDDDALVLLGPPGSGKSTLCAALVTRGWRLLSDEFALISTTTGKLSPLPRPVSLKDQSIDLIRSRCEPDELGPVIRDTRKGDLAHMRQPSSAVSAMHVAATPRWLVFPRYQPQVQTALEPMTRARAFMAATGQSFNYPVLGRRGFDSMQRFIRNCQTCQLEFSALDTAIDLLETL